MDISQIAQSLLDADIDFVVVGGLAVALHVCQRLTMDVNIAELTKIKEGRHG